MKFLLILTLFIVSLSARIDNRFFVINDSMTLECKDVLKINKLSNKMVQIVYTNSGRKKINDFSSKNLNKEFSLIAENTVIFLDMKITKPLAANHITIPSIEFYSKEGKIDKFINSFKHCKNLLSTKFK